MIEPITADSMRAAYSKVHMGVAPISKIIRAVSEGSGVSTDEILGGSRLKHIVAARHLAIWQSRQLGYSFPHIGRCFKRNHTSVQNACRKIDAKMKKEK